MHVLLFLAVFICSIVQITTQAYGNCYDAGGETACYYWHMNGMCRRLGYRNYMYKICRRTCNLCPSIYVHPYNIPTKKPLRACRDVRTKCPSWKRYCKPGNEYYKFMMKNCQRSCLICSDPTCKDLNWKCPQYVQTGYCDPDHLYFAYMRKNCAKSCEFCTSSASKTSGVKMAERPIVRVKKKFECDFETNECDWTNQFYEDSGDWLTGIDKNGPAKGFNDSKNYLYPSISHRGFKANLLLPWQLMLPEAGKSMGIMCFHFLYQISHGRLTVHETENPRMARKQPHPQTLLETLDYKLEWTRARLNVRADPNYNLMIVAEKGAEDTFIALDDFFFIKGKC